jgi:pimeloyl-ACP methyl ester carboxylesterase
MAWRGAADDVLAVADRLGVTEGGLAAGHSMGGAALLLAEQARPGTFARLWLYEPIAFPPVEGAIPRGGLADAARRRRASFTDRDAAFANYASKPPLSALDPAALRAYVDHGFRDQPDGHSVTLKCLPEVEAATFDAGVRADAFSGLPEVASEVVVAAGGEMQGPGALAPVLAQALPHGRFERFPELTHFGPMEAPPSMAAAIRNALALG